MLTYIIHFTNIKQFWIHTSVWTDEFHIKLLMILIHLTSTIHSRAYWKVINYYT